MTYEELKELNAYESYKFHWVTNQFSAGDLLTLQEEYNDWVWAQDGYDIPVESISVWYEKFTFDDFIKEYGFFGKDYKTFEEFIREDFWAEEYTKTWRCGIDYIYFDSPHEHDSGRLYDEKNGAPFETYYKAKSALKQIAKEAEEAGFQVFVMDNRITGYIKDGKPLHLPALGGTVIDFDMWIVPV